VSVLEFPPFSCPQFRVRLQCYRVLDIGAQTRLDRRTDFMFEVKFEKNCHKIQNCANLSKWNGLLCGALGDVVGSKTKTIFCDYMTHMLRSGQEYNSVLREMLITTSRVERR
jgi:hypothetical protein